MVNNENNPLDNALRRRLSKPNVVAERGFSQMTDSLDGRIRNVFSKFIEGVDVSKSAETLAQAIINKGLTDLLSDIYMLTQWTESPVEALFYYGLVLSAVEQGINIKTGYKNKRPYHYFYRADANCTDSEGIPTVTIMPQSQIGEYRVDFLIEYEQDIIETDDQGNDKGVQFRSSIIVECDGHDFHEKTKAQASKDKKRDRVLQSVGYRVFRFTGSDIYKDPISCAEEVYGLFHQEVGDDYYTEPSI